jgi:hypothetical protein
VRKDLIAALAVVALAQVVSAGAAAATAADGKDRHVTILNDTDRRVQGFFPRDPIVIQTFEEDYLGDRYLEPGQSIRLEIYDGTNQCRYDFRVEFTEGAPVHDSVDVCETREWRVSAGKP